MTGEEYLAGYGKSVKEVAYIEECVKKGSISKEEGEEKKKEEFKKQDSIVKSIFSVKEPMSSVLYRRYVLGEDLKRIAKGTNYSYSHIRKLHRKGVKEIGITINI